MGSLWVWCLDLQSNSIKIHRWCCSYVSCISPMIFPPRSIVCCSYVSCISQWLSHFPNIPNQSSKTQVIFIQEPSSHGFSIASTVGFSKKKSATRRKAEEFRHTAGDDSDISPYFTIIPVTSRPIRSFLQMTPPDRDYILWTFFETIELIKEKRIIPDFPMMIRSPVFPSDLKFPNSKKQKTCPLPSSCGWAVSGISSSVLTRSIYWLGHSDKSRMWKTRECIFSTWNIFGKLH